MRETSKIHLGQCYFNGAQEDSRGAVRAYLFTDRVTRGTFASPSLKRTDVFEALKRKRGEFATQELEN